MAEPLVVQDVWKRYGPLEVLRGVSFDLGAGDVAGLAGRSGSGKSTLFKLIAGLDAADRGSIKLGDEEVAALTGDAAASYRLRRVGLVFQSYNLLPDLTAEQNVALPLQLAGHGKESRVARAKELLAIVDVQARAAQKPHRLSGGEAQRVAIARALANDPGLLLADEPTSNLDAASAERVLDAFDEANRSCGTSVLIVSHDDLVLQRLPRVMRLDDGVVAAPHEAAV